MLAQRRYLAAIATHRSDNSGEESVAIKVVRDRLKDDPPNQKHRRSNYNHGHVTHSSNDREGQQPHCEKKKEEEEEEEEEKVPSEKRGTKSLWNHHTAVVKDSFSKEKKLPQLTAFQQSQMRWNSYSVMEPNKLSRNYHQQPQNILGVEADQKDDAEDDDALIQSRNGSTSPSRIRPIRAIVPSLRETGGLGLSVPQEEEEDNEECNLISSKDGDVGVKDICETSSTHDHKKQNHEKHGYNYRRDHNFGDVRDEPQEKASTTMKCLLSDKQSNFVSVKSRLKQWNNVILAEPPKARVSSNKAQGGSNGGSNNGPSSPQGGVGGGSDMFRSTKIKTKSIVGTVSAETNGGLQRPKQSPTVVVTGTTSIGKEIIGKHQQPQQQQQQQQEPVPSEPQSQLEKQHLDNVEMPRSNSQNPSRMCIKQRALVFGATVSRSALDVSKRNGHDQRRGDGNSGDVTIQNDGDKIDFPTLNENVPNLNHDANRTSIQRHGGNHGEGGKNDRFHHRRDKNEVETNGEVGKTSSDDCQNKDSIENCIPKANDCLGIETCIAASGGVRDIRSLFESRPGKGSSRAYPPLKRTSISKSSSTNEAKKATCYTIGINSNNQLHVARDKGVKINRENEIVKISVKETERKNEPKAFSAKNMESCTVGGSEPTSFGKASKSLPDDTNLTNATSTSVGNEKMASVEDVGKGTIVTSKTRDVSTRGFNALRSKFESISINQKTSHHSQNDSGRFRKASEVSNLRVTHTHHKLSQATTDSDILETDEKDATTSDKGIVVSALHPPVKQSSPIGCRKRSAFENIRSRFNGEERHSRSPDHYQPDNSLVQFVNSQRVLKQSSIIQESSIQVQPQSKLLCDQKQRSVYEVHRKSAFNIYNASMLKSSKQKDRDGNARAKKDDINMLPPNDIPWKQIEPNDIPWTDRELLEERERSFSTQKVDMSFSYGAEYLDYSYEDDDCDGVTLCPSASDVSSLSVPSCLRSVDVSSETSFASRTSDEDTGAMESMSEKQSTTLGPSEASSSQTSEAAAPLIHSTLGAMSMRFASSSDTTGTFSYNGAQFNALLGALPPPIDGEESDDNSDDLVFQQLNKRCYNYEKNKQFEDELKFQSGPKWKNDFFAVDSVKSLPTVDSADVNWVPFPTDSSGKESLHKKSTKCPVDKKETNDFHSVQRLARNSSKYFSVKSTSYPTQDARMASPFNVSQNSTPTPLPRRVESTQSDTENRVPKPNDVTTESKLGTGAYRRFDVHRVRAFQQARRNKSFAPT